MFNGESSWTAKEDVRLLDAIEQYGYGNWVDIAKHIERRSPDGELVSGGHPPRIHEQKNSKVSNR